MKELSIEEKAKAYDEAIINGSRLWECGEITRENYEYMFPELKESEDEKIRKTLIEYFKVYPKDYYCELKTSHIIAWLEKQGEQKYNFSIDNSYENTSFPFTAIVKSSNKLVNIISGQLNSDCKYYIKYQSDTADKYRIYRPNELILSSSIDINPSEFDLRLNKLLKQFETLPKEELASSLSFYLNVVQNDGTYKADEKQGEHKPTIEMKTPEESLGIDSDTYNKIVDECIYGEQKHTDKVEPKFHEGEWVFIEEIKGFKNGPFQIKTVDSLGYSFDEYHIIPLMYEDLLSKWTIQDAKDGDVLVCYSKVKDSSIEQAGIFKQYNGRHGGCSNAFFAHTGIDWDGNIIINGYMGSTNILPATKEQRDLLFQKIKEAGYEWDDKKKELKEIIDEKQIKKNLQDNSFRRMFEQNTSNEIGNYDHGKVLESLMSTEMKTPEESLGISSEEYNKIVDECIYGEQKPTKGAKGNDREIPFSEQEPVLIIPKFRVGDEIKTSNEESLTITKIDKKGYWSEDLFICGFGGECLWDLVEQKPAWSEEDEAMWAEIADLLWEGYKQSGSKFSWDDIRNWVNPKLKSLKDRVLSQPKQEWSEEDNKHIKSIISTIECSKAQFPNSPAVLEAYNSDLIWLKSLRPQSTWKPSDEQINALAKNVEYVNVGCTQPILKALLEDLKKLKG